MKMMVIAALSALLGAWAHFHWNSPKSSLKSFPPNPLSQVASHTGQRWPFKKVILETSGKQVIDFHPSTENHRILKEEIMRAAEQLRLEMSKDNSPVRNLRRINEASRLFEDRLREIITQSPDFSCTIPKTTTGKSQRSGYPDLRIEHLSSKTVAYLDPKLFEEKSLNSSFRSFYYEPNQETLKVTEDALHFLLGFSHDGKTQAWTFTKCHLVDLSKITLKLKTEFSASNREIYSESSMIRPGHD